jgi:tetratricopeptide (TPR) repeat protein
MELRELRILTSTGSLSVDAKECCRTARELEDAGKYDEARKVLGDFWLGVGEPPNVNGLSKEAQAEVLLRAGVLTGFIGSSRKIEGAQETAKDLIGQSVTIFDSLGLSNYVTEAYINLARCYQRGGSFDEARVLLRAALEGLNSAETVELKARALLLSAYVEREAGRLHDAASIHQNLEPSIHACPNKTVKGSCHNERAIVFRRLATAENKVEYFDSALEHYKLAISCFTEAGHLHYSAAVENNIGFLLYTLKRYREAHRHIDRARKLALNIKDRQLLAQMNESKARIFLGERRLQEAERVAWLSVRALERGDEYYLLAESLRTHGQVLARLGRTSQAMQSLSRAIDASNHVEDLESAGRTWLVMMEELSQHLSLDQKCAAFKEASRLLDKAQDPTISSRLLACANRLVAALADMKPDSEKIESVPGPTEEWDTFSLQDALTDYEKLIIRRALTDAGGVVKRAARYLKIDHQLLFSKLKNKHRDLEHLKATSACPAKRSLALVKPPSKNVTLMPGTFQICLPPGRAYSYLEVTSDKLLSKGVRRNDLLVWAKSEAQENDLVVVRVSVKSQKVPAKYEYGQLIYEGPKRIKLKTDEGESRSFDVTQVSIEGRVLGYCKAADVEICRKSFNTGGGCLSLEVRTL